MEILNILLPTIVGATITIIVPRIWQIYTMRRKIQIELIEEFVNYYHYPATIFGGNTEIIQQYYWKSDLPKDINDMPQLPKKLKYRSSGECNDIKLPKEKFPEIGIKIMKETFMKRIPPRLFILINLYVGEKFETELRSTIGNNMVVIKHLLMDLENCNNIKEVNNILSLLSEINTTLDENISEFLKKLLKTKIYNPSFIDNFNFIHDQFR